MRHNLLASAVALALFTAPAQAGAPAPPRAGAEKFARSEVVAAGTVTSIGKDTVLVPSPYPGAKDKVEYRVAVVKVDSGLAGAEKGKELKVGVLVPPKPGPKPRRPVRPPPQIKEQQQVLLYLCKHPTEDFYVMPSLNPPADLKDANGKKELEVARKFAAALADPMNGLKSDKPAVRAETATFLLLKYGAYPELAPGVERVAIPAEESKLILSALLEGDWKSTYSRPPATDVPSPLAAFYQLYLTEKDGWLAPVIAAPPGTPQPDYGLVMKDAFARWRAGPGKGYVVKKNVPK